jgi:CheY-like chemotaxis protein/HPt (histidine-containing phosphotransfer) domain-containing protein
MTLREAGGLDFIRALRAVAAPQPIVLVLCPAAASLAAKTLSELSINAALPKPVPRDGLLRAIERALATDAASEASPSLASPSGSADARAKAHVLVAEDNPINQRVARAMLEALGCRVQIVGDGEQALAALAKQAFDLVFMDCQMPNLDGYAAAREWRLRETAGPRTPIIALTAHAMPGEREKCLGSGMDDYATKPFTQDQLAALLERWAPDCQAAPEVAAPASAALASDRERFDASAIDALRKLDSAGDDFTASLVEDFVDRASRMLFDARAALAEADVAGVRGIAHQLKANAAQLGTRRASQAAARLEQAARANAPAPELSPLLDALERELREVLPILLAAVASPRGPNA